MKTEDMMGKHREMVLRLKKPGEAILKTLTPFNCDLILMGGCPCGEAAELYDAMENNDHEEILEELGDMAFYLVAIRNLFFGADKDLWTRRLASGTVPSAHAIQIMVASGHLWDVVKRVTVYLKPMDVPDSKFDGRRLDDVALEYCDTIERHMHSIIVAYGFTLEQVLENNWNKLASADKGRYASGQYSDEQAQERRDKQPAK